MKAKLLIPTALLLISAATAAALFGMITPSSEAVRVRNSLVYEVVDPEVLRWAPPKYPASFKLDAVGPPALFVDVAGGIERSTTHEDEALGVALAIGRHLGGRKIVGGAIQSDTVSTLQTIMSEGRGYCADFTQVFNGLSHALALPVREWGMSFDGFGGNGHAFNEVYDQQTGQWIFVDSFYSFYVIDRKSTRPMSALEFNDRLRDRESWLSMQVVPISEIRFGFTSDVRAFEYYHQGVDEFYQWWGNNVFEYDSSRLVRWAAKISRAAEQAVAIVSGVHPQIRIPRLKENEDSIATLSNTRSKFVLLLAIEFVAVGALLFYLAAIIRRRLVTRESHQ